MKRKLTVTTLALGNLRQRRKQYFLLIIGIVLSVAFSASILLFYTASNQSLEESRKNRVGEQQLIIYDTENKDLSVLLQADPTMQFTTVKNVGFAYLTEEERLQGMSIAVGNEAWRKMNRQEISMGRFPETKGEIAVEASALSKMMLDVQIGEEFTLFVEIPDGKGGILETREQTFTLVGILQDKRRGIRYESGWERELSVYNDVPAAFLADTETVADGGMAVTLTYCKGEQETGKTILNLYNKTDYADDHFRIDTFYEGFYTSEDSTQTNSSFNIISLLGVVLVIGSCFGIVTAFNMNLQERRRQIGLLRAVGATKKQIVNVFGREALIIALCSVPAGILLSYGGVLLAIHLLGDEFVFRPAWYVFVLSALLGLAVVMLAAMIPLITAARITPMQALRNTDLSVKMKRRKIKSRSQFNVAGLLAGREMKLRGSKQIGLTLFLSIGILVSTLGVSMLLEEFSNNYRSATDFHISASEQYMYSWFNYKDATYFSENDRARIYANPYVKDVYASRSVNITVDYGKLTPYMLEGASQFALDYPELDAEFDTTLYFAPDPEDMVVRPEIQDMLTDLELPETVYTVQLIALEEGAVELLLEQASENDTDLDAINAGESVVVIAPKGYYLIKYPSGGWGSSSITSRTTARELESADRIVYRDAFYTGEDLTLHWMRIPFEAQDDFKSPEFSHRIKQVKIGAVIDEVDFHELEKYHSTIYYGQTCIFTTAQGLANMGFEAGIKGMDVNLYDNTDPVAQASVLELLKEIGSRVNSSYTFSDYEYAQQVEQDMKEVTVLLVSLILLFFCITAASLCNTTNARIRESRRIIGTLRAVGAAGRDLRMVYIRQYLYIFGIGCGVGYGITALFKLGIFIFEKITEQEYFMHHITLWPSFVFVGALILVCILNLSVRLRRETKNSIVENIREL
ncbi:MAG: FtsX-like permease family protein [Clostridia bacterium]|nr:FtsX-like permease family protein [Clostridia bacterium]